uniref:Uncharacterized protein LOC104228861 n=1 Tax=Nicotiana sylvestris TaxID=4096 RepID=A0A1U7WYG1_NICSY
MAIKSQELADFVTDFSSKIMPEVEREVVHASPQIQDLWILYTDDASNTSGSGLGLVLEVPIGEVIRQSVRYPDMTNNEAEYKAVIVGLRLALKYGDSKLPDDKKEAKKLRMQAARTTPKTSTREMPYSLVYGTDAIILVDVGDPSLRYSHESEPRNDESRRQELDEAEERRDMAYIRMVAQKQQAEHYDNKKAKVRPLKVRDYMLKAKTQASRDTREGKLRANWDGPYKVTPA